MADGGEVIFKFLGDDKQLQSTLKSVTNVAKTGLKAITASTMAVAGAFTAVVTESVKARGELEQLVGGVNKIFGDSANQVVENANKAFKTAGISANQYMEQVTSFSASLIQATAGDTEKASRIADQAIIDMADNVNTFGSSMESVQSAFQRFCETKLYHA